MVPALCPAPGSGPWDVLRVTMVLGRWQWVRAKAHEGPQPGPLLLLFWAYSPVWSG